MIKIMRRDLRISKCNYYHSSCRYVHLSYATQKENIPYFNRGTEILSKYVFAYYAFNFDY